MADESGAEAVVADLSPELAGWLEDRANAAGVDRAEFLGRLAAAFHAVETDGEAAVTDVRDLGALQSDLADLEAEVDEKIEDVRERVVQVKRETDQKAPADHEHPDLDGSSEPSGPSEDIPALRRRIESIGDEVEDVRSTIGTVQSRTEAGFENYETVLEDLMDRIDRVEGRLETLAETTAAIQSSIEEIRGRAEVAEQVEAIKREANRMGVAHADCEDCGTGLEVALLTEPACPSCGEPFAGVERRSSFLGSHTLSTGSPPALEAGDAERVDVSEETVSEPGHGGSS
jgi:predicted  nucleic acid-binding Zn-ribbon protein